MATFDVTIRADGTKILDLIKLKANQKYEVVLRVSDKELPSVITSISEGVEIGSKGIMPVDERNVTEDYPVVMIFRHDIVTTGARTRHYVGGKRDKGISGRDLVLEVLRGANRPFRYEEISTAFVQRGFAGNSASPNLNLLAKEGLIRNLGHGKYELVRHQRHSSEG